MLVWHLLTEMEKKNGKMIEKASHRLSLPIKQLIDSVTLLPLLEIMELLLFSAYKSYQIRSTR